VLILIKTTFLGKIYKSHVCECILNIFKIFNDTTYNLSSIIYSIAHLAVQKCVNVSSVSNKYSGDTLLSPCIDVIKTKRLKYYLKILDVNLFASILDPRMRINSL
jgi:hypothetical protein